MLVTRDGTTFNVKAIDGDMRFWEDHFAIGWERETKTVIDRFVEGGTFVDLGAWVGPVSLWAAHRGARVIAVEPDSAAYPHLVHNLSANCRKFSAEQLAIAAHNGTTRLGRRVHWGDSMSSLTAKTDTVEVRCLTLESFLSRFDLSDLQLIKMDIEGGEGIVIPQSADYLRRLGVPLCLSLHPQWSPRDPLPYLTDWRAETIAPGEMLLFPPPRSHAAKSPLTRQASAPITISLALIVKNEEQTLARCLESVRGAVDEIVVVDTGSSDGTKTIAEQQGARVLDFAWRDDFAAARQYAFDQTKGDWVFWLDADDVVVDASALRELTSRAPADIGGFYWRYVLARDAQGRPTFASWRERCVRNDGSFRWAGRVHEVLVPTRPAALVRSDAVLVEHRPERREHAVSRRNLNILEEELAASGAAPVPRLLFYLGREFADVGDLPRAIDTLKRYVAVGTWADERYIAQIQIADLYRSQGLYAESLEACWAALAILPRWPDAYFGLAATYYFLREWDKVLHWTDIGRSLPVPDTSLFQNLRAYESGWIIYYTNALYHQARLAEALAWTRTALSFEPDNAWHLQNERVFASADAGASRHASTDR